MDFYRIEAGKLKNKRGNEYRSYVDNVSFITAIRSNQDRCFAALLEYMENDFHIQYSAVHYSS